MEIDFKIQSSAIADATEQEVLEILKAALRRESSLAIARRDAFSRACRAFEQRFNITSDDFMQKFEAGELGDETAFFDWYAAKRGMDLWVRRSHILSEVSV